MKIIITEQQDEKLTRRVKMIVDKLGLEDAIKMLGNNIKIIRHAYENNPLEFLNNFKDLEIITHPDYPDSIFFKKKGKVVMEQDMKSKVFWFDYNSIWSFFERVFDMEGQEIQELLTKWLKETLNLKGYTPVKIYIESDFMLEETLKLEGYTPQQLMTELNLRWKRLSI